MYVYICYIQNLGWQPSPFMEKSMHRDVISGKAERKLSLGNAFVVKDMTQM